MAQAYTYSISVPVILDNIIGAGRVPLLVAVLIGMVPGARSRELGCHEPFLNRLVSSASARLGARQISGDDAIARAPWIRIEPRGLVPPRARRSPIRSVRHRAVTVRVVFWWKPAGDAEGEWVSVSWRPNERSRCHGMSASHQTRPTDHGPCRVIGNRGPRSLTNRRCRWSISTCGTFKTPGRRRSVRRSRRARTTALLV